MNRLSWSKAKTLNRCKRQFKYSYLTDVEEDAEERSEELMRTGKDFHEFMEAYYVRLNEPSLKRAKRLCNEMFPERDYEANVENFHYWNIKLRDRFGEHWRPVLTEEKLEVPDTQTRDVVDTEKVKTDPVEGITHVGIIDRVQYDPETETYGIIDYKTKAKTGSNIKGQVAYYAFLCEADGLLDMVPQWGGSFGYETGEFERWKIHWQSEKAVARKIGALKQQITERGDYPPDFDFHCSYCGFREQCMLEDIGVEEWEAQYDTE